MGKPSDRILNQVYKTSPKLKNKHLFKTKLHATGTDCKNGNTVRTQPSRVQCHLFDGFIFPSCKADSAKVFSCDLCLLSNPSQITFRNVSKRVLESLRNHLADAFCCFVRAKDTSQGSGDLVHQGCQTHLLRHGMI